MSALIMPWFESCLYLLHCIVPVVLKLKCAPEDFFKIQIAEPSPRAFDREHGSGTKSISIIYPGDPAALRKPHFEKCFSFLTNLHKSFPSFWFNKLMHIFFMPGTFFAVNTNIGFVCDGRVIFHHSGSLPHSHSINVGHLTCFIF